MKTILLFLFPYILAAQQTTLRGVVAVFNSKFETGQTVYVANAQVEEEFQRAQATTTRSDGTFSLALVGIKERSGFTLKVWKPDFEVVNSDQLRAIAGQRDAVRIFMAPRGKIAENKRKYYQIGRTESEKALNSKIALKQQELASLAEKQSNDAAERNSLRREIADLYERYNTIDQSARELAERFSRVNLDDASELYQRAFRHFQNGSIDSALLVLDEVNWEARVDSILDEEARLIALQNVIAYNDSVLTQRRDSLSAAIRIKIRSHLGLGQYQEALRDGQWLVRLHEQDTVALSEACRQVAWLALLAQEYALAKQYAQTGLEVAGGSDQALQRYLAFAHFFLDEADQGRLSMQQLRDDPVTGGAVFRAALEGALEEMERAGLPGEVLAALRRME